MRSVPNRTVEVLARHLPRILAAVKADSRDTRLVNAVRMVGKEVVKLKAIDHDNDK